jgi:hypothetical protein
MTTVTISCLYSEKAVKNFYGRIIGSHKQFEEQLISLYEDELDKYDELRNAINHHREVSKRAYQCVCYSTKMLSFYREVTKAGGMDKFITEQHKFVCAVFDEMEEEFHAIFAIEED